MQNITQTNLFQHIAILTIIQLAILAIHLLLTIKSKKHGKKITQTRQRPQKAKDIKNLFRITRRHTSLKSN